MLYNFWESSAYGVFYSTIDNKKNIQTLTSTATGYNAFDAYSSALLKIFPSFFPNNTEIVYTITSVNSYLENMEKIEKEIPEVIEEVPEKEEILSGYWESSKKYTVNFILKNGETSSFTASSSATGKNYEDANNASLFALFKQVLIPIDTVSYSDALSSVSSYFENV